MKLLYKSFCGRYQIEFEGQDNQSLFEQVATFQEIFENDSNLTIENVKVASSDVKLRVRGTSESKFYEMYVAEGSKMAGYRLDYTVTKNGNMMFPRRKDKEGNLIKNNGWYRYEAVKKEDSVKEQKSAADLSKNAPY